MLDYEKLMEMARKKAREESELLYPFWQPEKREKAYAKLRVKYYREYTQPNA